MLRLQSDLSSLIDQRLSYPIRVEFLPCTIEGQQVLAARVPEQLTYYTLGGKP